MSIKRIALMAAALFVAAGCEVERTRDGELPEVEGGRLPEYDVDADRDVDLPDVDLPDVDVHMDSATIPVPKIDVNPDSAR